MSTLELKKRVIDKLEGVEDPTLQDVLSLLEFQETNEIYTVSKAERKAIEVGLKQIENGEFFTHEQVSDEINAWLKE